EEGEEPCFVDRHARAQQSKRQHVTSRATSAGPKEGREILGRDRPFLGGKGVEQIFKPAKQGASCVVRWRRSSGQVLRDGCGLFLQLGHQGFCRGRKVTVALVDDADSALCRGVRQGAVGQAFQREGR